MVQQSQEIMQSYRSFDIFFLPSEKVVFDFVTLEAMASGLQCILSKDGGNMEIIHDGINGILCERGDVRGFANSIELILHSNKLRNNITYNCVRTI